MRVVIVDDHALFRQGLRNLLEARGVEVLAEGANGGDALSLARAHMPDIVLMDLRMSPMDGLEATRLLSAEMPETRVVVLTASEDDADLFEAIKSGAQGYLLKNLQAEQFFALLEDVARGEPAFTPGLARKLLGEFARGRNAPQPQSLDLLTDREQEVLELLVQGITSNRDLAAHLVVSENTVRYHLRNIMDKLHLRNRAQVVAYAVRNNLTRPGSG